MFNDDQISIQFEEFQPSERTRRLFRNVADRLANDAPSDAYLKLILRKAGKSFYGSCRIAARAGIFSSEASCESPESALGRIQSEVGRKLFQWKINRPKVQLRSVV